MTFHRGLFDLIRARQGMVPWVLTVNILLYPLLTYLGTPSVQSHAHAQWVVVCTLQGEKAVQVDFNSGSGQAPEACPALKLMHQLASANEVALCELPALVLHALIGQLVANRYSYLSPHVRTYPSRAPPTA